MGKALIITEKPSVARDITKALGGFEEKKKGDYFESDEFVCTYAVGHILTLFAPEDIKPQYKRWRLADLPIIPEEFQTKPVPKQESRLKVISRLINRKDVDTLINACDAAREGELIFREIVKHVGSEKPIRRLWLQSMTKQAILTGFKNLEDGLKYNGLAAAAECRANADWLIGMNATRALTVRLKSRNQRGVSWSAGRVQTPTLALLVKRELEVLDHVPVAYWKVTAKFQAGNEYDSTWFDPDFDRKNATRDQKEDRIFEKEKAEKIVAAVTGQEGLAREIRKPSPKKAPPLFDLTSLQRAANTRFGWSATRTLRAAQRCYETHKVLTYPRTSSKHLPNDYREEVDKVLKIFSDDQNYGPHAQTLLDKGLLNDDKIFDDAKVTDHFAIIPTGELKNDLEGDDGKLYDLVSRQFMAAFYPPAIYEDVERITEVKGYSFRSKPPKVLKEPGWEAVFGKKAGGPEESFPPLVEGQDKSDNVKVNNLNSESEEFATKPPSRISEAGLLSLMENAGRQVEDAELAEALNSAEGLGTAATRADIIENLKNREYVDAKLRPTPKGIRLIDVLDRIHASRLTSAKLTAELELFLNDVEKGVRTGDGFMSEIANYAEDVVVATRDFDWDEIYKDEDPVGKCPKCQKDVFEKAWFYGCTESTKRVGKKNCDFLVWKDNNGRYINRQVVRDLLEKGETGELDGFKNASGKEYKGILTIENGTVTRKTTSDAIPGPDETFEVNPEPIAPCPNAMDEGCLVVETPHDFVCKHKAEAKEGEESTGCGFKFPRMLCKREIKREEVEAYLKDGETPVMAGFVSKRGRKFAAKLVMEKGGDSFRFEFPPRASKKKKEDEEATQSEESQSSEAKTADDKTSKPSKKKVKKSEASES
ncbi:DNA topoisomerase [Pseudobacteriovorax antillogorgiicola]|uniref:DNA topoisomerase n=1 Tax=Pseudobacteriovorax antillogorgiicola TaxID=1513793 RepID=A0A1Y6C0H3_9BACT|nr:DNA topoisomerase [Pseudobacteriovorax antillogorgiicola]TCS51164.1 DNA topoisomerase-3 [Pseudobacteriovorax antillogorgiicola]SMF38103.1 DNA topoisomerase-3 [Pseudobacteriovorax antillogorgiicola]